MTAKRGRIWADLMQAGARLPAPSSEFALSRPPADGHREDCPSCHGLGNQYIGALLATDDDAEVGEVRCRDCFGVGWLGGGFVAVHGTYAATIGIECPRCSAAPGERCEGRATRYFRPGKSCHAERWRAGAASVGLERLDTAQAR